jgi:hypothetical protein
LKYSGGLEIELILNTHTQEEPDASSGIKATAFESVEPNLGLGTSQSSRGQGILFKENKQQS